VPADLPNIIADGVSTAMAAISANPADDQVEARDAALEQAAEARADALEKAADSREAAVEQALAAAESARAKAVKLAGAHGDHDIDALIQMRALGVTPEYVAAMRAAAPALSRLDPEDFAGLKAVGVSPDFARDLVAAGFRNIDEDGLTEARAIGLTGSYIRSLTAFGVSLEDVRAALQAGKTNRPKGDIDVNGNRLQIYTNYGAMRGARLSAADYRDLVVAWRNGAAVRPEQNQHCGRSRATGAV